jgi:enediyne biosynthesis protein E3
MLVRDRRLLLTSSIRHLTSRLCALMLSTLRRVLFSLSPKEASFERREFACDDPRVRADLEEILRTFIAGYNLTLATRDHELLAQTLEREFDAHHVGFAFEGAGMCCALLDLLVPRRTSRLRKLTDGAGRQHDYIATVGAGFAVARLPYGLRVWGRYAEKLDPMVAWCVLDGYGFHQGIFHRRPFVEECREPPARLPSYGKQLFDAGLGRSLWWSKGASPVLIRKSIDRFPEPRRSEMWHGVGVACTYAGGVKEATLLELLELSGRYRADFLSGLPFAARMRQKGGNASPATDMACGLLLRMTTDSAADLVVRFLAEITATWPGTERELGTLGYMLVRQRVTGALQTEAKETALAFHQAF